MYKAVYLQADTIYYQLICLILMQLVVHRTVSCNACTLPCDNLTVIQNWCWLQSKTGILSRPKLLLLIF